MIDDHAIISRNRDTASRTVGGEAIVLTPMDSKIHSLNETGSRIWELLADSPSFGQIVACIHREFEATEDQARRDALAFVEDLAERGMIAVTPSADGDTGA
jgi:hypothetical protein